jgi:hypothetical protein
MRRAPQTRRRLGRRDRDRNVERSLDETRVELLAEVLRRCMGLSAEDNARHDFGDLIGGALQRPTEVAAELLRALSDEGLTIAVIPESER